MTIPGGLSAGLAVGCGELGMSKANARDADVGV